jgi:hypothetical protein
VRVAAADLNEHGFGLVVGADARFVYIATARHVVARRPPAGLDGAETAEPGDRHRLLRAAGDGVGTTRRVGRRLRGAADDLVLLRTPRPAGYDLELQALAPPERQGIGDAVWPLGREGPTASWCPPRAR